MALYSRDSSLFWQSVRGVSCGHPVDGGCDPDRWAGVLGRLDTLRLGSLAGCAPSHHEPYSLAQSLRETCVKSGTKRDEVRSTLLSSRPSRHSRASRATLRCTTGRSLSADRPPASLGIHEGSFEALAFFAELQTIFLDPPIDFPP